MPELPEVETIARNIRELIFWPTHGNIVIEAVDLRWDKTLAAPDAESFQGRILGQTIETITRRGKYLHCHLSRDHLLIHLRMSGDLSIQQCPYLPNKHDRLIMWLSRDIALVFNDPRKFGRVWLLEDPDEVLGKLGPEPLNEQISGAQFYRRLQDYRRQIKPLLLDQHFLAGVGNIYADEALHLAKLHPQTRSHMLTHADAERLLQSIQHVLQEGIQRNGASIDWAYRGGEFQNLFQVYQRTGEPCYRCQTPIERISVGQRGTHFCPTCQPLTEG